MMSELVGIKKKSNSCKWRGFAVKCIDAFCVW